MKIKLSQCMIVKNEETNIRRALSWGKGIVSEQIVVDTGSADNTVQIAKEMGAKVYYFEWINDFAAAKNFALSKASGDWILFLDADEYFKSEDAKKIPKILLAFSMKKYGKEKEQLLGDIIHTDLVDLDIDGKVVSVHTQARIFRNTPHIRYHGAIHEYVDGDKDYPAFIAKVGKLLPIYHTGYAWKNEEQRKKKGQRNLDLIEKELEKNPDHALTQLYMAESLCVNYEWDKALAYAEKAIQNKDRSLEKNEWIAAYQLIFYELYRRISIDTKEDEILETEKRMKELYQEAIKLDENYPDFDMALGFLLYYKKDWKEAQWYLETAIQKADRQEKILISRFPSLLEQIYDELTEACIKNRNLGKMVHYTVSYLKEINLYYDRLTKRLLEVFSKDVTIQAPDILKFLRQMYDFTKEKDLLYILKCVKEIHFDNLENLLKEYLSEKQRENVYPKKKYLEIPKKEKNLAGDHDFYILIENIYNTTQIGLSFFIQDNWKKLLKEQRAIGLMILQNCMYDSPLGRFDLENKETSLMENRAEALHQNLRKFIWLYEVLGDYRSKKILSYLIRNWLSFGTGLLTAIKETLNPPYFEPDLYIPDKTKAVVDISDDEGNGFQDYQKVYGKQSYKKYYCVQIDEKKYEGTAINLELQDVTVQYIDIYHIENFSWIENREEEIGLIKLDVKGKEAEVLKRTETIIKRNKPILAAAAWYQYEEIIEAAEQILQIEPKYQLYLRYYGTEFFPDNYGLIAVYKKEEK